MSRTDGDLCGTLSSRRRVRSGDPDAVVSAAVASLRPGQAYVAYACFKGGSGVHASDVFVATGAGGPPLWDPHIAPWLTDERVRRC